jgi:tetrahydromethanopterin S-methyltransferase subunit B
VGEPTSNVFNILDYAKTADQIDNMAKDLNTLVSSVNQSAPKIQGLSRQAGADAQKLVDHGFWLGLVLIAVLLSGSVLAGLLYTFLAQQLKQPSARPPNPGG